MLSYRVVTEKDKVGNVTKETIFRLNGFGVYEVVQLFEYIYEYY